MPKNKTKKTLLSQKIRFSQKQSLLIVGGLVLVGLLVFLRTFAAGADQIRLGKDNPRRGLKFSGLASNAFGPCHHLLQFRKNVTTTNGKSLCTHGPDPAPADVDASVYQSPANISSKVGASQQQKYASYSSFNANQNSMPQVNWPCVGTGQDGSRVQILYAYQSGNPNNLSSLTGSFTTIIKHLEGSFQQSAAETGGNVLAKFVTNSSCTLSMVPVQVSASAMSDFGTMINELKSKGYSSNSRKYLIEAEANTYCGVGTVNGDDQPGSSNAANIYAGYARVDNGCWGFGETHELGHTLGAVNLSAPHSTSYYHCRDAYDIMCYNDGAPNNPGTYTACSDQSHYWKYDCNHDDYFSTNPPAGSYLATHWDIARSQFLYSPPPPPTAPTGLHVTSTTTTSFNDSWSASSGSVKDYVQWVQSPNGNVVGYGPIGCCSAGIGNLTAGSTYIFWVQAESSNGTRSAASAKVSVTLPGGSSNLEIISVQSGRCIDDAGSNTANLASIVTYDCHGTSNQLWTFAPDGTIRLKLNPNKCLDDTASNTTNGTHLILYDCYATTNQKWSYNSDQTIRSALSNNKCIAASSTADSAPLIIYDCNGASNEKWTRR